MSNWRTCLVQPEMPIVRAIQIIEEGGIQIAFVVDPEGCLRGTVTDGDVRRGILKGVGLEKPVSVIMNHDPVVGTMEMGRQAILQLMQSRMLRHVPIVDSGRRIVNVEVLEELLSPGQHENTIVLMAGGIGKRLYPLTRQCPKPMLRVGEQPILEQILERFIEQGFSSFYFAVNYMAEVVENYFGDGSDWGVHIDYLREDQPLGTAGALSLIKGRPQWPILVMNGDLLTKLNFGQLLDFHHEQRSKATMCVREYDLQVPYGVVSVSEDTIERIEEKPVYTYFVNSGIYVLDPDVLDRIPAGTFINMTDVFDDLVRSRDRVSAFPVREYWLDIGQRDDLKKAKGDFKRIF